MLIRPGVLSVYMDLEMGSGQNLFTGSWAQAYDDKDLVMPSYVILMAECKLFWIHGPTIHT